MIFELICLPFLGIINGFIGLLPVLEYVPEGFSDTVSMLTTAMKFFPADVWVFCVGNIVFWLIVHSSWSIISFALKYCIGRG